MAWFNFIDPAWSASSRGVPGSFLGLRGLLREAPHGRNTRLLNPAAGWASKGGEDEKPVVVFPRSHYYTSFWLFKANFRPTYHNFQRRT